MHNLWIILIKYILLQINHNNWFYLFILFVMVSYPMIWEGCPQKTYVQKELASQKVKEPMVHTITFLGRNTFRLYVSQSRNILF